ncbi:MAG: cytochrome P450 [Deltaproteobacteria bacterium]|nr:cytochrome P450 [Deltaproteobacteria bacterium]
MAVTFDPTDPGFLDDPYPTYARLRREAPIHRHPTGFVVVSRYADVTRVLKTPEVFSSEAMGGSQPRTGSDGEIAPTSGSLIGQDPPVHTRQRSIVNRGFTPGRIAGYEPRIRQVVEDLFERFESTGQVELIGQLAAPLPVTMIAELLGLDPKRRDDFKRWSNSLIVASTSPGESRSDPKHRQNFAEFRQYIREVIEERRAAPRDDLVSVLVNAEERDGVLTPDQVFAFASLLLAAGSETTMNLIGNAVLALLAHPDALERVCADLSLVPRLIEETVRWDPPVQMVMRLTTRETELGGEALPARAMVIVLLAAANRDPDTFPDPDRFDLDRNTQGHLGFGFGNHFCLGASLARLEARVALESVLGRLAKLRPGDSRVERHGSFLVRGASALPLAFDA